MGLDVFFGPENREHNGHVPSGDFPCLTGFHLWAGIGNFAIQPSCMQYGLFPYSWYKEQMSPSELVEQRDALATYLSTHTEQEVLAELGDDEYKFTQLTSLLKALTYAVEQGYGAQASN